MSMRNLLDILIRLSLHSRSLFQFPILLPVQELQTKPEMLNIPFQTAQSRGNFHFPSDLNLLFTQGLPLDLNPIAL